MNEVDAQQAWQRAVHAYQANDPKLAKKWVSQITHHSAADGNTFLLAGIVDMQLQDWQSAEQNLNKAIRKLPGNVDALMALANTLQHMGRSEQALPLYEKAADLDPQNIQAMHNIGVCLEDMGRAFDALQQYDKTLTFDPSFELSLRARPPLLGRLRRFEEARDLYHSLISQYPGDHSLRLDFAELLEQSNLVDQCAEVIPNATEDMDSISLARICALRAQLLIRQGEFSDALSLVKAGRQKTGQEYLQFIEGKLLDRLGDFSGAIRSFEKANAAVAKQKRFSRISSVQVFDYVNDKISRGIQTYPSQSNANDRNPVFLVGLPRSGTTLLNRMLNAHPQIQVLEEVEALRLSETELNNGSSPKQAVEKYWDVVAQHIELNENSIVVDKSPYHPMALDVLGQLFPQSKVVFTLRHPYDSALSCFMQDFNPGPVNAQFLKLKTSAALCANFLRLMQMYERENSERVLRVHYEVLVQNFKSEVQTILEFIGLPWNEEILDYAKIAERSGPIMTASYSQVTKKLYHSAIDRWKNYAPWLEDVSAELRPMLDDFGYSEILNPDL